MRKNSSRLSNESQDESIDVDEARGAKLQPRGAMAGQTARRGHRLQNVDDTDILADGMNLVNSPKSLLKAQTGQNTGNTTTFSVYKGLLNSQLNSRKNLNAVSPPQEQANEARGEVSSPPP